ncbi:MAG TPA: M20/M25/M40 family metallo-hydrolase [Candidatus Eisenbacteria bacterium]|nr:M20/M25/M40 family metallo-hydrolase [Candidatus Eisenbacteria bacterium]
MNLLDRLSALVAIDSHSSTDNTPIISLLQSWFADYSTEIQEWKREDGVQGKNLLVTIPGKSKEKTLVFVGHTDTVPSSPSWSTDPLKVVEKDGKLYGLGTCDTKGGIAAVIEAAFTLTEKPSYDTVLVFDGDEEMSSVGAITYQKSLSLKNPLFICLEPTFQQVHIGQRALLKCTLIAKGQAIHAGQATPENSAMNNAINKMHHIMSMLIDDAKELGKQSDPLLGSNTQNFGIIQGGTARNVFASSCQVVFERRLLTSLNPQKEFERLSSLIQKVEPDVQLVLDQIEPGFSTKEDDPFVQNVLSAVKKVYPASITAAFPAWSEAGLVSQNGPAVIVGPGDIAKNAHRANEYVEKEELLSYVTIFQDILLQK